MDKSFSASKISAVEARFDAQKIAFAPIVFQCVRLLRDLGILEAVESAGEAGIRPEETAAAVDVSEYGVRVLLETGLSAGILDLRNDRYVLTKSGFFILHDEMTRVNMDFVQDVCYRGMFHLEQAIRTGKPSGLKVFGDWRTIYEALSSLPDDVKSSWFRFDHYYSDSAFTAALPLVFKDKPRRLLDIGGNTGKWAIACAQYSGEARITIVDLPGQIDKAQKEISRLKLNDRIGFKEMDLLDHSRRFPAGYDALWMSQFLVCFSEDDVLQLLRRAALALAGKSCLYILDTYWDRQRYDIAAYCLINTSPYFTCMANGNSRMYRSDRMKDFVEEAGLRIVEEHDGLGMGHTLFKCSRVRRAGG